MGFEPVHIRARFDGQTFVPEPPAELSLQNGETADEVDAPKPIFGSAKGMIHITEDFDDPLEDFPE